jgi:hypothetical protein
MNEDEIRLLIGNSNDDLAKARIALSKRDFDEALDYIRNAEAMVEALADEETDDE